MDVTNDDNTVEVDLWYSSSMDLGLKLDSELAALSTSHKNSDSSKPLFTPRIASYSCTKCDDDFKQTTCLSDGLYCGFMPDFYTEYGLAEKGVSMTGREVLIQGLREKCLHKIMSEKYNDEGSLFWTFSGYVRQCFVDSDLNKNVPLPKSLAECYDWSTVMIRDHEEVGTLNSCVDGSFETEGDLESDNSILRDDRKWANQNHI